MKINFLNNQIVLHTVVFSDKWISLQKILLQYDFLHLLFLDRNHFKDWLYLPIDKVHINIYSMGEKKKEEKGLRYL